MLQCCRSTKPFIFKELIQSTANLLRNVYIALHWEDAGKMHFIFTSFPLPFPSKLFVRKKIYWDLHGWLINERFPRGINHRLIWKGRLSLEKQAVQKNISASHNCYCKNRSFLLGKLLSKYFYVLHDCLILREIHFGFNPSEIQLLFLSCKYSTFWVDPGSRMVTCIWKIWLEQVEPIH